MNSRTFITVLSLATIFVFSACKKKPGEGTTPTPTPGPTATPTGTPAPTPTPITNQNPPVLNYPQPYAERPYLDANGNCWTVDQQSWEADRYPLNWATKEERPPRYLRDREKAIDQAIAKYPHLFKTKQFNWGSCVAVVPDPGQPEWESYETLTNHAIADELRHMGYCVGVVSFHYVAVAKINDEGHEVYQGVVSGNSCLRRGEGGYDSLTYFPGLPE